MAPQGCHEIHLVFHDPCPMCVGFPFLFRPMARQLIFHRPYPMCAGSPLFSRQLALHLNFPLTQDESTQVPHEVGALRAELVLRHVPRKAVQRPGHPLRLRRLLTLLRPRRQTPRDHVVRTRPQPLRLGALLHLPPTLRVRATPLPLSYPRVWTKPTTTHATRTLLHHASRRATSPAPDPDLPTPLGSPRYPPRRTLRPPPLPTSPRTTFRERDRVTFRERRSGCISEGKCRCETVSRVHSEGVSPTCW